MRMLPLDHMPLSGHDNPKPQIPKALSIALDILFLGTGYALQDRYPLPLP